MAVIRVWRNISSIQRAQKSVQWLGEAQTAAELILMNSRLIKFRRHHETQFTF